MSAAVTRSASGALLSMGLQGPQGPIGPTGPAGPSGVAAVGQWNISNYGADPTGNTYSDTAFSTVCALATSAGGGEIIVPAGTFLIQNTIVLPENTFLVGVNQYVSNIVKNTPGDVVGSYATINSSSGGNRGAININLGTTYGRTLANWAPGTSYALGTLLQVNGCRLLKCTTAGTSGSYRPLGQLSWMAVSSGAYPTSPAITITGTPTSTLNLAIWIVSPTTFKWTTDGGTTLSSPVTFAGGNTYSITGGLSATFASGTYAAGDVAGSPSFGWSLIVGTSITDGSCVWEVIDAGAAFCDVSGSNIYLENVSLSNAVTGLLLDQTELSTFRNVTCGNALGQGFAGVWVTNGCSHSPTGHTGYSNQLSFYGLTSTGFQNSIVVDGNENVTIDGGLTGSSSFSAATFAGTQGLTVRHMYFEYAPAPLTLTTNTSSGSAVLAMSSVSGLVVGNRVLIIDSNGSNSQECAIQSISGSNVTLATTLTFTAHSATTSVYLYSPVRFTTHEFQMQYLGPLIATAGVLPQVGGTYRVLFDQCWVNLGPVFIDLLFDSPTQGEVAGLTLKDNSLQPCSLAVIRGATNIVRGLFDLGGNIVNSVLCDSVPSSVYGGSVYMSPVYASGYSHGIGINAPATVAGLNLGGSLANVPVGITVSGGPASYVGQTDNANIALPSNSTAIEITGYTSGEGSYSISGFAAGIPGQLLDVTIIPKGQVTLKHLALSTSGNQLNLPGSQDLELIPFGVNSVQFRYSSTASSWIFKSTSAIPFVPTNIANSFVCWFRADLGVTSSGGTASAWIDQSFKGNNAIQGTTASQPAYTASNGNFNNRSTLAFTYSPANTYMTISSLTIPQPYTIVMVANNSDTTGVACGNSAGTAGLIIQDSSGHVYMSAGTALNSSTPLAQGNCAGGIVIAVFNGASSAIYVNSHTAAATGNAGTTAISASNFTIGYASGSNSWPGYIPEFMIFQGVPTPADIIRLLTYLGGRYNIPWS